MYTVVRARDLAIEREEERNGVLGDRVRRVGRHARDGEAKFLRGREVNTVETGAAQGDVLHSQLCKRLEASAVNAVVDKGADCPCTLRGCGSFGGEAVIHEAPLDSESISGA